MAEARNLEEFVYGPDGDNNRNLQSCIRDVIEQAKLREEDVRRIRAILLIKPTGLGNSTSSEWNKVFPVDLAPESVASALMEALYDNPGEGFSGQVRIVFSVDGHSADKLGSYSRMMRPALYPSTLDENGHPTTTNTGRLRSHFDDAVRPSLEMMLRAFDRGVALLDAGSRVVAASHPPPPTPQEQNAGVAADLLKGFVGVATAAGQAEQLQQGGKIAQTLLTAPVNNSGGHRPPSPIPYPKQHRPPSPSRLPGSYDSGPPLLEDRRAMTAPSGASDAPTPVTEAQVAAWASANPEAAKRMALDAWKRGGA